MSPSPTISPGVAPPRNSPAMETLPTAPYTMAMMLGGTMAAMVEAAATRAAENAGSYPSRFMYGMTTVLIAATSAVMEPEMPAKSSSRGSPHAPARSGSGQRRPAPSG